MSASRGPFDFGASNYTVKKTLRRKYDPTGINYKTLLGQSSKPQLQQKFQRYKPDVNPLAQDMAAYEGTIEPTPARKVELLKDFYKEKMTALQAVYDDLPTVPGRNGTYLDVTRSKHFKAWLKKKAEAKGEPVPDVGTGKYNAMASTYTRVIDAKMQAYSSIIAQLNASGGAEAVLDAYLRGFHCFLRGRPTEEHQRKLKKLGMKPTFEPFRQESVQQYLKAFSRVKKEYYEDLAMLRMQGPTGDLHQIELYYKYIIDGKEDEKIEQNLWHWLEGGKLPKHTGRLLGKGSHTSLVSQLSAEFPVGTMNPGPVEQAAGNRLGGRGGAGGGGFNPGPGGGGGGPPPPRDDDDQPPGGDEGPKITPSQRSFLDDVRRAMAEFVGIKSEPQESAEQILEKEKQAVETAIVESNVDEQIRENTVRQSALDTAMAYVLSGGDWPQEPEAVIPDWQLIGQEGQGLVHDVALYRDLAREAIELRDASEKLQEKFPKEAADAAEQYDQMVQELLALEAHLEGNLNEDQKRALFSLREQDIEVDVAEADDDDATGQINEEEEPLNAGAGAESDDEKEPLPPVKKSNKSDKGKEKVDGDLPEQRPDDDDPRFRPAQNWDAHLAKIEQLSAKKEKVEAAKEVDESMSEEDRKLEQRISELGGEKADIEQPEAERHKLLETRAVLKAAPAAPKTDPGHQGPDTLPSTAGSVAEALAKGFEADDYVTSDTAPEEERQRLESAVFEANLAKLLESYMPEVPKNLKTTELTTPEEWKDKTKRANKFIGDYAEQVGAWLVAAFKHPDSVADQLDGADMGEPLFNDIMKKFEEADRNLASAIENGEGPLKYSREEMARSSDELLRVMQTRDYGHDRDTVLTDWAMNTLAPIRNLAQATFNTFQAEAVNRIHTNHIHTTRHLQAAMRNALTKNTEENMKGLDKQQREVAERVIALENMTPAELTRIRNVSEATNNVLLNTFKSTVEELIQVSRQNAERAVEQATKFLPAGVEIPEADKEAFTKSLELAGAIPAIQETLRGVKTVAQRRQAERNEPKSRLYNPEASWLRSTRRVEQREKNEATLKSNRTKAIEKARKLPASFNREGPIEKKKLPASFSQPYKRFERKIGREKMSAEEEERVTRGL